MPHDISLIGPLNIDLLIKGDGPSNWDALPNWDGPAQIDMTAAGSIGYTVQNLARFGLSLSVSSCLPDDPLGLFIEDALRGAGVDVDLVHRIPGTLVGIGVYMLLFGNSKRPLIYRLPTHPLWPTEFAPGEIDRLFDARILYQGGYLHFQDAWHGILVDLFREAKVRGLITSLDPQFPVIAMSPPWMTALDDLLPYVDLLFCDDSEARNIAGIQNADLAARFLLDAGVQTVIVKQGADGSTIYRADGQQHQPATVLGRVEDTIGAGDAYDAGFLYATLQGWPLADCALFASIAAGFSVLGVGGTQAIPELAVILAEMDKRR